MTTEATCAHCGAQIVERTISTTSHDSLAWFHDRGADREFRWQRACGWAEPRPDTHPTATPEES